MKISLLLARVAIEQGRGTLDLQHVKNETGTVAKSTAYKRN